MKNVVRVFALSVLAISCAALAQAGTEVSVHVDIGGAPPAPQFVFHAAPIVEYEPQTQVYVVNDPACAHADCFHYGPYWYTFNAGYWYRAHSWRGPFAVVHPRYVPEALYRVPAARWKYHAVRAEERHEARRIDRREDRREERHVERHEHHGHGHDGDDHDGRGEHGGDRR